MILWREVFSAFDLLQRRREVVCKPFAVFDFLELVRDAPYDAGGVANR